jgi:ferredoxin/flavodoxin---NADP+ reductase
MSNKYNAVVVGREELNRALIVLRVKPDSDVFDFKAGQFGVLGLTYHEQRIDYSDQEEKTPNDPEKVIRRAYSIASANIQKHYLEFYITLVHSGELTPRLFALEIGDRLFLGKKASGLFTLDKVPEEKDVILIATGTGLAPYMSFLRSHLIMGQKRNYVVLHGSRYSWDLGYRAELETLATVCPNFTYIPSITRPEKDPYFGGLTGRLQNFLENGSIEEKSGLKLDPEKVEVFLCGNPAMIEVVTEILEVKGFKEDKRKEPGTIHTEKYW